MTPRFSVKATNADPSSSSALPIMQAWAAALTFGASQGCSQD